MAEEILSTTLHHLVATVRRIAVLLHPFLPNASHSILTAAGTTLADTASTRSLGNLAGISVTKPAALFPRL